MCLITGATSVIGSKNNGTALSFGLPEQRIISGTTRSSQ
jgi:hypothetical protein